MPSFAYSGHRHEQHAPFTASAIRFVEFLTPAESLEKHRRWSEGAGRSSFIIHLLIDGQHSQAWLQKKGKGEKKRERKKNKRSNEKKKGILTNAGRLN